MSNVVAGLIAVVALLGGFYGGYRYESAKLVSTTGTPTASATAGAGGAGGGRFAGGAGGGFAQGGGVGAGAFGGGRGGAGTVTNLTSTGFTLHSANGTDTKVTLASSASVRKTVDGSLSDLQNNLTVTVTGTRDANGNLTATVITIIPAITAAPSPGG